jgi:hypothetical protein
MNIKGDNSRGIKPGKLNNNIYTTDKMRTLINPKKRPQGKG